MTPERNGSSELGHQKSRIRYFEEEKEAIMKKYLETPISVHTTMDFAEWVQNNINPREAPPYSGILKPCDEEGNLVLFPWARSYDVALHIRDLLANGGMEGFFEGIVSEDRGINLAKRSTRGLKIPWRELVAISHTRRLSRPDR